MAGEPLKKVQTGERLVIPAAAYNAFIDAANAERARRLSRAGGPAAPPPPTGGVVLVKNTTGSAVGRFGVLALGDPLIDPGDDENEFAARVAFEGAAPGDPVEAGNWCVTLEPIDAGGVGRALASGVSICRLNVGGGVEDFAEAAVGQTGYLVASATGTARVLWVEASGGSERWAVVRLGDGAGSGGGIDIEEGDGSPSYAGVVTIIVDQSDGLRLTQPGGAGTATLSIQDASASQAGIVSTTTQTFGGDKTFADDVEVQGTFVVTNGSKNTNLWQEQLSVADGSGNIVAIDLDPDTFPFAVHFRIGTGGNPSTFHLTSASNGLLVCRNANGLGLPTGTPVGGSPVLAIQGGTADPTGFVSGYAGLYVKDIGGTDELRAFDDAGNFTTLSEHSRTGPAWLYDAGDANPRVGYEENHRLGVRRWINWTRAMRLLERLFAGEDVSALPAELRTVMHEENYEPEEV